MDGLHAIQKTLPVIRDVRGRGLLIGIELSVPAGPVVDACREAGLLALTAGTRCCAWSRPHRGVAGLRAGAGDHRRGSARKAGVRHLVYSGDLTREQVLHLFALAAELKQRWKAGRRDTPLAGRSLALIFEKPSLRTRVTFEVGVLQLGGRAVYLSGTEIGLGTRESVPDVARNLSRCVNASWPAWTRTRRWRGGHATIPS